MYNPKILFRKNFSNKEEFEIAAKYFPVIELRTDCKPSSTIIGRYSTLPYYNELYKDILNLGGSLINDYRSHAWIADFEYYEELKKLTPESWDDYNFWKCDYDGPFIVKGKTNSRKDNWNKLMYAKNKYEALEVASNLVKDPEIANQGLVYRKFVELEYQTEEAINGLRYANEWRFFYFKSNLLEYGYYWSIAENTKYFSMDNAGIEFANNIAKIACQFVNFFVVDIAKTKNGDWILIELNDGQQSGLSCCDANKLYANLKSCLENDEQHSGLS